jgi:L-seryl-tRNA(Ser) seleniumtransferase
VEAFRSVIQQARREYREERTSLPAEENLLNQAAQQLRVWLTPSLVPVINATGVIIHTNLGRAPLSADTLERVAGVSGGYSNLEFDLGKGRRGSRLIHAEQSFQQLLGVEAAFVVNNNAAAVLLALTVLTRGKKVIISRSQLVEIGGGFRIPDVLKHSGTDLVEVGTTNKVHLFDYQEAYNGDTAAVMRAHSSNFSIVGFTSQPPLPELVASAHQAGLLFIDDLGSGALLDTADFGLKHEPMVQQSLQAGADLVCFSGDKLLGGPQAGIILGKRTLIDQLKRHPLARAIRADKMALVGLSATLEHYLKEEALEKIPVWKMISSPAEQLKHRAERWQQKAGFGKIRESRSMVGGGSLPGETLPTFGWSLETAHPQRFLNDLRHSDPPLVARIEDDRVVLDPRTVLPHQDERLIHIVENCWRDHEA